MLSKINQTSGYITTRERTELIRKIGNLMFNSKSFWLFCHINPDGDSLGSCLATYGVLASIGKQVHMFSPDKLPRMFEFLPHAESVTATEILPETLPDIIITADNAHFSRLGSKYTSQLTAMGIGPDAVQKTDKCTVINIDHHIDNQRYGDINLIDPSVGACGELFYHLFRQLKLPLTLDIAINLYATILTDTGRFSYGNTSEQTFQIASDLIRIGVDPFDVVNRVYNRRTVEQIVLMSRILATVKPHEDLNYVTCYVTQDMLRETGTEMSDTEGVLDVIKSLGDYTVSFFLKEEQNGSIKVSARTNGGFNCSDFAHRFAGGGHPAAAGFKMDVSMANAPAELEEELKLFLEESPNTISTDGEHRDDQ